MEDQPPPGRLQIPMIPLRIASEKESPMASREDEKVSGKVLFTFSIVMLTPILLTIIFEKIQHPLIKGIGGF